MGDRGRWRPLVARRFAGGLLIGVLTGLAATGCSGDPPDDPVTLPPATTTPSSSATSTEPTPTDTAPTPTTSITLLDEHDPTIDTFVQGLFAAYNAAQDTRDLSAFEALYLPQCTGCIEMRDELAGWLAEGRTVEGGDWHILQQTSNSIPDGSSGVFTLVAYRDSTTILSGDTTLESIEPTGVQLVLGSVRSRDGWAVEGIDFSDNST